MLVAGLMLSSCIGTGVDKGSMSPSATILPDVKYTELDFFDDGVPYYVPSHIRVLEPIWWVGTSRLNDTILTMNFEIQNEQVTFIIDDIDMKIRAMLYRYKVMDETEMTETRENYIYDGKPYPVKVTDAEMKIYMDTLSEQEDI